MSIFSYDMTEDSDLSKADRNQLLKLLLTSLLSNHAALKHKIGSDPSGDKLKFDHYELAVANTKRFINEGVVGLRDAGVKEAAAELLEQIKQTYEEVTSYPRNRPAFTEFDAMMDFYTELGCKNLDSVKVLEEGLAIDAHTNLHQHHIAVEIKHNNCVWIIEYISSSELGLRSKKTINGEFREALKGEATESLGLLFNSIAISRREEAIYKHKARISLREYPLSEAKAKAMQKIAGGRWEDYAGIASYLVASETCSRPKSEYERIVLEVMQSKLRLDPNSIKEIVKVFIKKPMYH